MNDETFTLTSDARAFITRWGEVGRAWGLPRSAAQVHGLLLIAAAPMTAEDIASALSIARSNVSTSVKELRAMGIIRAAAVSAGDRRERLEALSDPAEAAANLAAWRRAREIDPAIATLTAAAKSAKGEVSTRLSAYAEAARRLSAPADEPTVEDASPAPKKKKKKKSD